MSSPLSSYVYTPDDYKDNNGMLTNVWGPLLWVTLHTISFNYPVNPSTQDKEHYRNFILNLVHILPCRYCRDNLKANLKKCPLTLDVMESRDSFSRYVYNLHELVNTMLLKKSNITYEDARDMYEQFRSKCNKNNDNKNNNKSKVLSKSFKKTLNKQNKNKKTKTIKNKRRKKEKGCTHPLHGKKSKCIINIVPANFKNKTMKSLNILKS